MGIQKTLIWIQFHINLFVITFFMVYFLYQIVKFVRLFDIFVLQFIDETYTIQGVS